MLFSPMLSQATVTRRGFASRLAAALATGSLLSACRPALSVEQAGKRGEDALGKPAHVVWLNWEAGPAQVTGNDQSVQSFQARYPHITVENSAQGSAYWERLSALQAAGTPPDIWEWEPKHVVDYVLRRRALDLNPLARRDKHDLSDFFRKRLSSTAGGKGFGGCRATSRTANCSTTSPRSSVPVCLVQPLTGKSWIGPGKYFWK